MNNPIKEALAQGRTVLGSWALLNSAAAVEVLARAGFDFVIIDTEHGAYGVEAVEPLVLAARAAGITPMVRVREPNASLISLALDTGATGVLVPQVQGAAAARQAVAAARYHPLGSRGLNVYTRGGNFGEIPADFFAAANAETLVAVQIEGQAAVDELDAIMEIPGLDVIFVGPYDLSQALGRPGQVQHPQVQETIRQIIRRTRERGLVAGIYADTVETALAWARAGVQYLTVRPDTALLLAGARQFVAAFRQAGGGPD